jgi:hypothetical protein
MVELLKHERDENRLRQGLIREYGTLTEAEQRDLDELMNSHFAWEEFPEAVANELPENRAQFLRLLKPYLPDKTPDALRGGMDRPKALAPCEGEHHTGETTLTRAELDDLKEVLEDEDTIEKPKVLLVIKALRPTLSSEYDKNLLEEAQAVLTKQGTRAETLNRAIGLLITLIDRVFPKSGGRMRGGVVPERNYLQQIADASYKENPPRRIGASRLLQSTPTLKFYLNGNTILVGIRGTKPTDMEDLKADAMIALNDLDKSSRFQKDLATLQQFQSRFPPSSYEYYGIGHSLGGAILDQFITMGLLKNGLSYNPAVQPKDLQKASTNQRIYNENDPLYALMGKQTQGAEVRKAKPASWWENILYKVPYAGTAYKAYQKLQAHQLGNFVGGKKAHATFEAQLKEIGYSPAKYLADARAKAKEEGLPSHLLGFANDGVHKLTIPDHDGKMVLFGRLGYGDYLIWKHLEKAGKVEAGKAEQKRSVFQKSHSAIKGNWKQNPLSPNSLALGVLW